MRKNRWWLAGVALTAVALTSVSAVAASLPSPNDQLRQLQRQKEYLTPAFQAKLAEVSKENLAEAKRILKTDPERGFETTVCWSLVSFCAGDARLYDWEKNGYGMVEPVLFTNRNGATISGHVWATRSGAAKRPLIVITNGSVQATEQMYWWAAQTLAKAGFVVLTSDPQVQGRSDFFGEGRDKLTGLPQQLRGGTFYGGMVDEIDFGVSTPADTFCPRLSSTKTSHCAKQERRVTEGFNNAFNPYWEMIDPTAKVGVAGHSYGAMGASWTGQQDPRVGAIVAWDNLCQLRKLPGIALVASCQPGFEGPVPEYRTPALGISNDYGAYFVPHPTIVQPGGHAAASMEISDHDVDSGQLVVRGGTHFEYDWAPLPFLAATLRGVDMTAWYTTAWFDKYLRHDPTADARLRTTRWLTDARDRAVDPKGGGNVLSNTYLSRMDIGRHGGERFDCEDLVSQCPGMGPDGEAPDYSFLETATTPDGS
ncbi:MAG: hypothetical protein NTV23_04235 [Propionibacteriales bacterium]|nr:hypothetical protein [Propionibacteriales bacterium]